jgi:class 3 adenylate cyclase
VRTKSLAIVFTDVEGFSDRSSRLTLEQNERLLATLSALLKPVFEVFGGRIVKNLGDTFLVLFDSSTHAVRCGTALVDQVWEHNRSVAETERLPLRVAVNTGEVRLEAGDVFGEPVNVASRVLGVAKSGEVFFTEAVYLTMNRAEVPVEEVGRFTLKGVPEKVRIFKAEKRTEGAGAPFGKMALGQLVGAALAPSGSGAAALAGLRDRVGGKWVVALAVAAALGVGAFWFRSPDEVRAAEKAIAAIEGSAGEERQARIARAQSLLEKVKTSRDAEYLRGRLSEAFGDIKASIGRYEVGAREGSDDAADRLIALLEHDECDVREKAAKALGEAGVKSARSELEQLSERPEDEGGFLGLGCNSKRAAARALEKLR